MLSFKTFISEGANLAPGELYKYEWRVELFLDMYKNGKPFRLANGKDIVLKYDEEVEKAIRNKDNPRKITLVGLDNGIYKLSNFAKTQEFGGGGGSGAGAEMTKIAESAQCVYAAARWMGKTDYMQDALETAYKVSRVDTSLANVLNELPENWVKSSIVGAEKLYDTFGSKQYTFHRGSAWVDRLETLFKKLNKKDKHFTNINKWSPADIYMVSPAGANIKFDTIDNIQELNNILIEALKTKDIIGVSLKLLKKTAKVTYYNFGSSKPTVEFDKYTTGNKGFFGAKDVYIYFTVNGKIQFRTFPQTFQGEIKGKQANQGKLSYGPINKILAQLKLPQLINSQKLKAGIARGDVELVNKLYEFYTRYSTESKKVTHSEFKDAVAEKGPDWMYSKFIGCQLIDIITKNSREGDFVTACIQYDSSSSELSAPFIKLS